jgi:FtsH-binding integral membrane protein
MVSPLGQATPGDARANARHRQQASTARVQLFMMAALIVSIAVAATAVSIGYARASSMLPVAEPHAGLVVALMVAAIGVMGGLSAVAVRFAGRPRQH